MTKSEFDSKFDLSYQKVLAEYRSKEKISELFDVKDSSNPTINELIANTYRVMLEFDKDLLYSVLAEVLEVEH
jgi:hypothetical protein